MNEMTEAALNEPVPVVIVPFKHVLGKYVIASVAVFVVGQLVSKGYDMTLAAVHSRQIPSVPPTTEG